MRKVSTRPPPGIGSVSGKDVRHPGQRWRTSPLGIEPIPDDMTVQKKTNRGKACRSLRDSSCKSALCRFIYSYAPRSFSDRFQGSLYTCLCPHHESRNR